MSLSPDAASGAPLQFKRTMRRHLAVALALCALALALSPHADAALGSDTASVVIDRNKMGGTSGSTATVSMSVNSASSGPSGSSSAHSTMTYTIQTIVTDAGTTIHEYLNASGVVFAIAWSGPFIPDLRQLLGDYFTPYASAAAAAASAANAASHTFGRGPMHLTHDDLVVQSSGGMRGFFGTAYLKSLLPGGFNADDIR